MFESAVYSVEFQKRGLPHAHIVLFLHRDYKILHPSDIDKIISAEIPNREENKELYNIVCDTMMHGPCGNANLISPCMQEGKCTKNYPKKYNNETTVDEEGFPVYRRRDTGASFEKNGVLLDNRHVVPYNMKLLMKYKAHINVEWCNQSRAVKYLFKYINKGNDRVTVKFTRKNTDNNDPQTIDEIQQYSDCRYVSACEAVWRIFGFELHYRTPPVERLSFHLPGEQTLVFDENQPIDSILNSPKIDKTMFLKWMKCNAKYPKAKKSYDTMNFRDILSGIKKREWSPRKKGFAIGRMYHAYPGSGERFYMRTLLNFVKGPTCYEDIKTVNGVLYPTFKEACYTMGLLDDDKEYIDAIVEASFWASGHYLRRLFAIMLMSNTISRSEFVWNNTWHLISEDILHQQWKILKIPGTNVASYIFNKYKH